MSVWRHLAAVLACPVTVTLAVPALIVWPSGGVRSALMGVGAVTVDPSAGDGAPTAGGGAEDDPLDEPGTEYAQFAATMFEMAGMPDSDAPTCRWSLPAFVPW